MDDGRGSAFLEETTWLGYMGLRNSCEKNWTFYTILM